MKYNKGFIALAAVLVLSAVFLALSIGMATQAIYGAKADMSLYASNKARILAESCVEQALAQLQRSVSYVGEERISIDEDTCDILTVGGVGNTDRTIQAQSTVSDHTYRLEVVVAEIDPTVKIASFESVINF